MRLPQELKRKLIGGGVGVILIKVSGMVLTMADSIVLVRILGPEEYGTYAYVLAAITLISIPANLGLPTLVVRETARADTNKDWEHMAGVWRWSTIFIGASSVALLLVSSFFVLLLSDNFSPAQLSTFMWGLFLIPIMALGNLRGASLRGLRKVVQGQLPEKVLRPGFLVLLLLPYLFVWPFGQLSASHAMALHAFAGGIALAIGIKLLWHHQPKELAKVTSVKFYHRAWLSSTLALALASSLQIINKRADILMLGFFASAEDVGVYQVSTQVTNLLAFGLGSINLLISPYIAKFYEQRMLQRLQKIITFSASIAFFVALLIGTILLLSGDKILEILFGEFYMRGHTALKILAVGQLFNTFFGSVGFVLSMTGHELDVTKGVFGAAIINILLNSLLVPQYGMVGAALSTATSYAIWNILLWRSVRLKLRIKSTALGLF